jgi:hypothetical protein
MKHLIKSTFYAAIFLLAGMSTSSIAQGNPTPSSWGTLSVKASDTYGNNNSRLLRRAKVTIEYEDPQKAAQYFAKHNVNIRMPQSKTTGSGQAMFTRVPPSNLVGPYTVTVEPNQPGCNEAKSKTYRMGNGGRRNLTFNFNCNNSRSSSNSNNTNSSSEAEPPKCHKVRIMPQGVDRRKYRNVNAQACPGKDGKWTIEPYEYK